MSSPENCHPEVVAAVEAAEALPEGRAQVAALREAVTLAKRVGGFADELYSRIQLTQALYHVPSHESDLAHFAWLRAALDREEQLDEDDRWRILWMLKWALARMEDTPSVPLSTIRRTVDDYESCLVAHGWQLRPVHAARARLARDTGDAEGMTHSLQLWQSTPRDGMSDCHACELREQARLVAESDPAGARELIEPVTSGHLTCGEEPALSLSDKATYSLRIGDVEGAVDAYRAGWRLAQGHETLAKAVATHVLVLTRLGNIDRAIEHLLPRLGWLDVVHSAGTRMRFLSAAALVLRVGARHGLTPDEVLGEPPVDLAARFEAEARDLARRFDARNGTTRQSELVAADLDESVVAADPTLPPLRVHATGAGRAETGVSIAALAERLTAQLDAYDPESITTCLTWLDERPRLLPAATPADDQHLALLDRIASRSRPREEARRLLESALAAARRAGDDTAAARAELELALAPDGEPTDDGSHHVPSPERQQQARDLADAIARAGSPDKAAHAWAHLATRLPDPAERVAACERALALYDESDRLPDPPDSSLGRIMARIEHALLLVQSGDPAGAAALDAIGAEPAAAATIPAIGLAEARGLLAWSRGEIDEAIEHLLRAVELAGASPGPATRSKAMLCDLYVNRDDWQALDPMARSLLAEAVALRNGELLAVAQRFAGLACVETGRPAEGAELLEAALPVIRRTNPPMVGPLGWALGRALDALEDSVGARTAFAASATAFEADERFTEAAHAHLRAGNAIWGSDNAAAAAHLDAAVEHSTRVRDVMLIAAALRDRAQLRGVEGDVTSALAELDGLVARLRAMPEAAEVEDGWFAWLDQGVRRQGALLADRAGRTDDAVRRLQAAEEAGAGDTAFAAVCRAERGAMLAEAGQLDEAERLIREAVVAFDPEYHSEVRTRCVGTLAQALHDSGQVERADSVWEELVVNARG